MLEETSGVRTTEDQEAFRRAVRQLARTELAPGYLARSRAAEFPWTELKKVAALGVLSLLAGEEHGGPEAPEYVAAGIACEEIAYADFNVANALIPPYIATFILSEFAAPELRAGWVPRLVGGETFLALGLTEPEVGSDAGNLRTAARRDGDGWVLDGEKTSITGIPFAEAAIVFARTSPDGARGVSAFLVPLDAPGVSLATIPDTGWVPLGRGSIALTGVRVPGSALVGGEGEGFRRVMAGFDFTRPLLALTAIGAAQAAVDEAAAWAARREAFGAPLSRFEGVSFLISEHSTKLAAARALCYQALDRRAHGEPHTALAAMCKWYGPRVAFEAAHDCLLLHGHYGYTTDNPMEQRLRDIMSVEIADGTAQVQKIIIARELYGRGFVPYGPAPEPPRSG
jgi:cyclohexanecarboxyl-CoA dehydrogenase